MRVGGGGRVRVGGGGRVRVGGGGRRNKKSMTENLSAARKGGESGETHCTLLSHDVSIHTYNLLILRNARISTQLMHNLLTFSPSQLVAQAVAEELQHEQGAASVEKVVNTDDENEV